MVESAWNFVRTYRAILIAGLVMYGAGVALFYRQLPERAQHFDVDSGAYYKVAINKITSGSFEINNYPLLHPIGYPAFLALLYWVMGDSIVWVVALQALLAFLSAIAITLTALYWYGQRTALYAFFIALANVGFYIFPQVLLVETLQLFCIAWAWERFVKFLVTDSKYCVLAAGFLMGLSLLYKPSAMHFPLFLSISLLIFSSDRKGFVEKYAVSGCLFIGAFYVPVWFIMTRNWFLWGYWKFSYLLEENLFYYFHHQLLVSIYGYSDSVAWGKSATLADRSYSPFDSQYWQQCYHAFKTTLTSHWDQAIAIWIKNSVKNCFGLYTRTLAIMTNPSLQMKLPSFFTGYAGLVGFKQYVVMVNPFVTAVALYEVLYSGIRWGLLIFGLYANKRDMLFWLTLLSGFYFLGLLCMAGNGRYRFVEEPLMIVFSAQALQLLIVRIKFSTNLFTLRKIA